MVIKQIYASFLLLVFSWLSAQTCPAIKAVDALGNEAPFINCDYPIVKPSCVNLSTQYPEIRRTDSYAVNSIAYEPIIPFNEGTALNANFDDVFPEKITLPFRFCFYGNSYNEVVIGSNGLLTFDSSQLGNVSYPNIQAENPSPLLPKNSIFGVLHDMVFSADGESEIYYSIIGDAPCRKLVVNFYKGRESGCTDAFSTSQIVLHEGTNIIDVFVEDKPAPCATAKFKEALIGILNEDGNQGVSPSGRNTGVWSSEMEGYRFTPNGTVVAPQFQWFNSDGQVIGNSQNIQVCPTQNAAYRVQVSYATCGSESYVLEDDIAIEFADDFPLAKDYTEYFCATVGNAQTVNLSDYLGQLTSQNPANFSITFHSSAANAESGASPLSSNQSVSANTIFYVRVQNPSDSNCYQVVKLEFKFMSEPLLTNTVTICDLSADGVETNFQLNLLNAQLVNSGFSGTLSYFSSLDNATNNVGALTHADITATTQLWVRLSVGTCSEVVGPITVDLQSGPTINTPIEQNIEMCDSKSDGSEPYLFSDLNSLFSSDSSLNYQYFNTYQQAYSGTGNEVSTIREGQYSVFVRVEIPGGCFSIGELKLNVVFSKIQANNKTYSICFDGTSDQTFNLYTLSQGMLIDSPTGITTSFYSTFNNADTGNPSDQISTTQTITGNGNYVSQTYYVRFENASGCYAIRQLTVALVYPAPIKSTLEICDFKNDGTETIKLSNYRQELIGSQNATVKFYNTETDANADTNEITVDAVINGSASYYIKIQSYGCSGVYPITVNLVEVPEVKEQVIVNQSEVCDNNADGTEPFDLTSLQSEIYTGADSVLFSYYLNYNEGTKTFSNRITNPTEFLAGESSVVYVKVEFVVGGCFSASTITINNDFLPEIILKQDVELGKCDYEFDLYESFNLPDAIALLFAEADNVIPLSSIEVTYYSSYNDANIGDPSARISETQVTDKSTVTVWARFESSQYGCYSTAPIVLRTYLPPKAIVSTITVCDENNDGSYDVNLLDYKDIMVDIPNAQNVYSFYLSEDDAKEGVNAIQNPENFTMNPFPSQIWVRVEIITGCFDIARVNFNFGNTITLDHNGPFEINDVCDEQNDGMETINLSQFEGDILGSGNVTFQYYPSLADLNNGTNVISNPSNYDFNNASGNQLYVKVSNGEDCPAFVKITVNLKTSPVFSLSDYYFCPYNDVSGNPGSVDIQPDFSSLNIASFEWKDPSGMVISTTSELLGVNTAGSYTISVVGENGCEFSTTFEVLHYEVPIITQVIPNGTSYTVNATGSKPIQYSIDGENWQDSNVFDNLNPGVVTFYIKFKDEDCVGVTRYGLILNIHNVFTPNADGINDTWHIEDLSVFDGQLAKVQIFDRMGTKVFEEQSAKRIEWNGYHAGRKLPTASYWYVLSLPDGRSFTGWILLKNRD